MDAHQIALEKVEKLKKELELAQQQAARLDPAASKEPAAGPGHLFVVKGDIRTIVADAYLIGSFSFMRVPPHWLPDGHRKSMNWGNAPDKVEGFRYVRRIESWPDGHQKPYCWVADSHDLEVLCNVQSEFVRYAKLLLFPKL